MRCRLILSFRLLSFRSQAQFLKPQPGGGRCKKEWFPGRLRARRLIARMLMTLTGKL